MPKTLYSPVYNWVKNVYSVCVSRGVNSGFLYTASPLTYTNTRSMSVQPQTFTHFVTSFAPALPTAFFAQFNLLNTHLYTLSTGPTITKTKEK